jgi:hypothetical protein
MLAEKFILILEALLRSNQYSDGSVRVQSRSPHVPITLTKEISAAPRPRGAVEDP